MNNFTFFVPPFLHLILIRLWSPPKNKLCQFKISVSQKSQWRLSQALHYCPILSSRGQKKNEEDKRLIWWIMTFVTWPLWRIIVGLINFILWYFVVKFLSPIIFTGRSTFNQSSPIRILIYSLNFQLFESINKIGWNSNEFCLIFCRLKVYNYRVITCLFYRYDR